jgi:hypothetical protein
MVLYMFLGIRLHRAQPIVVAMEDPALTTLICALCLALQTAINAGDVDGAQSYFADNAVVIQPRIGGMPEVYVGRDQIRWWLTAMAAQHADFEMLDNPRQIDTGVQWASTMRIDAYRQLGINALTLDADAVLADPQHFEALRISLTPASARALAASGSE